MSLSPHALAYPEAAQRYQQFLAEVFPPSLAESSPSPSAAEPESELEMQARWFAGEFGRKFTSTDGKDIEIIQFGHWNHSAGPDFTEVAVRIDGRKVNGTIEVDLDAGSWESHGHASNPAFEDVVLHVFLASSPPGVRFFSRTAEHREVTQVALDWVGLDDWGPRPWNHLPEARLGRCASPLRDMAPEKLDSLITAAAQYRVRKKSRRLAAVAAIHGADEALYQALAEALGYRRNKLPMRVLAQRLPLGTLSRTAAPGREARLFGAAGYIDLDHFVESGDPQTRRYLKELWDNWWKDRDRFEAGEERRLHWHLAGVRPLNHPQRRLGALVALVNSWPVLRKLVQKPGPDPASSIKKLKTYFTSLEHPYWNHHYTLRSKPAAKPMALVGSDRLQDILGNVLLPWLMLEHPEYWDQYTQLPGSQENEKLRRATLRLFGDKPGTTGGSSQGAGRAKGFHGQQALLQVYADFCLVDSSECAECPFPEQLGQW